MALTNHRVVKLAAAKFNLKNFQDYLILGDDVVIAHDQVAAEYQRIMISMGVGISLQKRIIPSPLQGAEFASKFVNKDGNIRPLPVALLLDGSVVSKLQFLSSVVSRVLQEGIQEVPTFRVLCDSIFGKNHREKFRRLFIFYFVFSNYLKASKKDLSKLNMSAEDFLYQTLIGVKPFEHI